MEFRTATPADVPSLYKLWAAAFDAPLMVPVYETDARRLDRTIVAVLPGAGTVPDRVVASVCWSPRTLVGLPRPRRGSHHARRGWRRERRLGP